MYIHKLSWWLLLCQENDEILIRIKYDNMVSGIQLQLCTDAISDDKYAGIIVYVISDSIHISDGERLPEIG